MRLLLLSLLGLGQTYVKDLADTTSVSDSITLLVERESSESISVSDASIIGVEFGRILSESLSVTDTAVWELTLGLTDTLSATDQRVVEVIYSRTGEDTTSATDFSSTALSISVHLSDVIHSRIGGGRSSMANMDAGDDGTPPSESDLILTDQISFVFELVRSDLVTILDSVLIEVEYARTLSDTIDLTELTSISAEHAFDFTDTFTIIDVGEHGFIVNSDVDDTISFDTELVLFEYEPGTDDTLIEVTDIFLRNVYYAREDDTSIFMLDSVLVQVSDETDNLVGIEGFDDFYMTVGDCGITFVAHVPAVLTKTGVKFRTAIRRAALLRAASTLAHWGIRDGGAIKFLREAAYIDQQTLAAMLGVSEAIVDSWESNQVEMPRTMFDILAALVCAKDQREFAENLILRPCDDKTRLFRIVPAIPQPDHPQIVPRGKVC